MTTPTSTASTTPTTVPVDIELDDEDELAASALAEGRASEMEVMGVVRVMTWGRVLVGVADEDGMGVVGDDEGIARADYGSA